MITYILVAIAAMINAVMDILENENFHDSRFRNFNQKFWYKRESWKYARKVFNYKIDAWHLAKSAMIVFLLAAIFFSPKLNWIHIIALGVLWNLTFNLAYKYFKKWK